MPLRRRYTRTHRLRNRKQRKTKQTRHKSRKQRGGEFEEHKYRFRVRLSHYGANNAHHFLNDINIIEENSQKIKEWYNARVEEMKAAGLLHNVQQIEIMYEGGDVFSVKLQFDLEANYGNGNAYEIMYDVFESIFSPDEDANYPIEINNAQYYIHGNSLDFNFI